MERATQQRMPIPDKIANSPELQDGLQFYYMAHVELGTTRGESGYIPWTAVYEYCKAYELVGEDAEDLIYLMRKMDAALIKFHKDRQPEAKKSGK